MTEKIIIGIILFIVGAILQIVYQHMIEKYKREEVKNDYWVYLVAGISFWCYCTGAKFLFL